MPTSNSLKSTARQAGFLYLLMLFVAPLSEFFLKARFIVSGNAAATALRINAEPVLYRLWLLADLASGVIFLLLALLLYELFRDVDRKQARLMLGLVFTGVGTGMIDSVCGAAPLLLLGHANYLAAFTPPQLEALAMFFIRLGGSSTVIATFFWGFWLLPFGSLVLKSGYYPKFLGVLLIVGGITYSALGFTNLVFPAYGPLVFKFGMPFYAAGELCIIFWLLLAEARIPDPAATLGPR
ncbi:MAG: DUF4386 domain-containing protein [Lacunisphaera sp.]|nr:DUF4386 domain-containing protein [Lacunisphaera sp.]